MKGLFLIVFVAVQSRLAILPLSTLQICCVNIKLQSAELVFGETSCCLSSTFGTGLVIIGNGVKSPVPLEAYRLERLG